MGIETIAIAGGAVLGAAGGLFGGDDTPPPMTKPPKPREYTQADLEKYGFKSIDKAKEVNNLVRLLNNQKESAMEQSAALKFATGKTAGSNEVWANVKPLADALQEGTIKIEQLSEQQKNDISKYLFSINTANEEEYQDKLWQVENQNRQLDAQRSSWWERAFEGGLQGLQLGTEIANIIPDSTSIKGGGKATAGMTNGTSNPTQNKNVLPNQNKIPEQNPIVPDAPVQPDNILPGNNNIPNTNESLGMKGKTNKILNFAKQSGYNDLDMPSFDEIMARYNPEYYRMKNLI